MNTHKSIEITTYFNSDATFRNSTITVYNSDNECEVYETNANQEMTNEYNGLAEGMPLFFQPKVQNTTKGFRISWIYGEPVNIMI